MPRKLCSWIRVISFLFVFAFSSVFALNSYAAHDVSVQHDGQYQLGMKVYSDYCSRCHGEHADGRGKIVPLYINMRVAMPSNFNLPFFSFRPKEYLVNIIRDGGEKHLLSEYMPPFGEELSSTQINDVVYFIQKVSVYTALNHKSK